MNILLSLAIAKTLLQSLWEGAAAAVALAIVLAVVKSPRVRYAAGCAAMAALLGGFVATFVRLAPAKAAAGGVTVSAMPVAVSAPVAGVARAARTAAAPARDYTSWIAPLWIAGVFVFYLRGMAGWFGEWRLRRRGICMASEFWRERFARLCGRARVELLESSLVDVPLVIGYVRPLILMPVGLMTAMPVGQVEAILLHELAHIRRYDRLVNLLQVSIEGLLFYHPAVWWISSVIRAERENCCDDAVVSVTGCAYEYAAALERLERGRVAPAFALAATDGNLVNRVARLLGKPQRRAFPAPAFAAALIGFTAIGASVALQPAPKPAPPPAPVRATVGAEVPKTIAVPRERKPVMVAQAAPVKPQPPQPVASGERKIAVGDVLMFSVVDQPEMSRHLTVDSHGAIAFPFVGSVPAAGKTAGELQTEIAGTLVERGILYHPAIAIGIGEEPVRRVAVLGMVRIPGMISISQPISVFEALAKAGGITAFGGTRVVVSRRAPEKSEEISIEELQTNARPIRPLTGGETVIVPDAPRVSIVGDVAHPGIVQLNGYVGVREILNRAGVPETADPAVYIYRSAGNTRRTEIPVSLSAIRNLKSDDVPLVGDDIILVASSEKDIATMRLLQTLVPVGAVK